MSLLVCYWCKYERASNNSCIAQSATCATPSIWSILLKISIELVYWTGKLLTAHPSRGFSIQYGDLDHLVQTYRGLGGIDRGFSCEE